MSLESPAALARIASLVDAALAADGKVVLFGNGGSAAHAQHVAAELVGRMGKRRTPLAALALTTDTSALTAFGNDFGFRHVFERQILALVAPGDVAVGITTSGRSPNVLAGLRAARERRATTIGFTGEGRGPLDRLCDVCFHAPSSDTQRTQELHIAAWHAVCAALDRLAVERASRSRGAKLRTHPRKIPSVRARPAR
jgi:D-sedoheptulose 7-phosphate isomerase